MTDESYSFASARARLDEIVAQVRRKDVSLEQSLDLLEEGVRLANSCTELIDHTEWRAVAGEQEPADGVEVNGEAAETDAGVEAGGPDIRPEAPGSDDASGQDAPREDADASAD